MQEHELLLNWRNLFRNLRASRDRLAGGDPNGGNQAWTPDTLAYHDLIAWLGDPTTTIEDRDQLKEVMSNLYVQMPSADNVVVYQGRGKSFRFVVDDWAPEKVMPLPEGLLAAKYHGYCRMVRFGYEDFDMYGSTGRNMSKS